MIIWHYRSQLKNVDLSGISTRTFGISQHFSVDFGSVRLSWRVSVHVYLWGWFWNCVFSTSTGLHTLCTINRAVKKFYRTFQILLVYKMDWTEFQLPEAVPSSSLLSIDWWFTIQSLEINLNNWIRYSDLSTAIKKVVNKLSLLWRKKMVKW